MKSWHRFTSYKPGYLHVLVNHPQYSELYWDGLSANYRQKMNVFLFHKWLFEKAALLWLILFFKQVATTAVHITEVINF